MIISRHNHIPVTKYTDENLTNDDPTNFKILHSCDPSGTADLEVLPARSEGRIKEGSKIANREQYVAGKPSQQIVP